MLPTNLPGVFIGVFVFKARGHHLILVGRQPQAGDYDGTGLGRTVMRALVDAASLRGLKKMEAFVLAVNQSMRLLASRMGSD